MARYILQEVIGRGSWSVVYKAVDDMTGDVVAVKELMEEAGLPKREVAIDRQVTHRNVRRIFEYFEGENGFSCIAMEYVDGGNLRNFMEQSGPAPVETCLSIAGQILDGLEAAHLQKIVHLDLKPENILLASDGTVKISDFGHARVIGTKPSLESKQVFGTPAYMAPEQAMGRDCDARADIFAFGMILHELLSGTRPEIPASPASSPLPSSVPAHVETAIKRCLEIDAARRFASVSEVRNALSAPQVTRPVPSIPRLTGPLLVSLAITLSVSIPLWNHFWVHAPMPRPTVALTPPAVEAKTVPGGTRRAVAENPPAVPKAIQRVAVMDFDNLTGDKSLDPYAVGISETLSAELGHVRGLTLVERNRVNEAIRELRLGRTGIASAQTARETGKLIGADSLVAGGFQKLGDKVRLTARVVDVETGVVVRAPAPVDGAFKDLFQLQAELAKQLAIAIQGAIQDGMTEVDRKAFQATMTAAATGHSLDAFEAFSDGLYFLRDDLAADALSKFDLALALDPTYPGAHHYRGVALAKLNRPDEAIDAFKRALPRSEPERLVLWNWDAPFTSIPASSGVVAPQHGIIRAMDTSQLHLQRDFFEGRKSADLQKRIIYGERSDKATVLHFLDLKGHGARRLEIPDENIALDATAFANDSFTVLWSADRTPGGLPRRFGFYAFSADSNPLWHMDLTEFGSDVPRFALIGEAFYIHSPGLQRFDLINARTGNLSWRREGLAIDGVDPPTVRHTKAYGDVLIVKSQDAYRAIRMSDGTDAWTVPVLSPKASDLANDRVLIVFEPERRIFTVDLETGKTVAEMNIEQFVDALRTPFGPKWLVGAVLEGNTLYVLSNDLDLCAIDLTAARPNPRPNPGPNARPNPLRLRWRASIKKRLQRIRVHGDRLYLGTDAGELIVMDARSGAVTQTTKLTEQPVVIEYAGDDGILVRSNNTLYGFGKLGAKNWEYPAIDPKSEATYFSGTIVVYTSPLQMSALEFATGKLLWQYPAERVPYVFTAAGRLFILQEKGVKEYAIGNGAARSASATARGVNEGVTDKETLTELARAYLAKGDLEQTRVFVEKASDIDGNYPPLTLVRARLLKAHGSVDAAGRELARYASLVGLDSKEGQRVISEVKRDHGLLWETAIGPDVAGDPVIIENRLVSVGRRVGRESHIVALDPQTGAAVWRYTAEAFAASVAAAMDMSGANVSPIGRNKESMSGANVSPIGRNKESLSYLWYVSGLEADSTIVTLYRIDIRTGERKQLATWHGPAHVDQAWITYAAGRIFVAAVSRDLDRSTLQVGIDCFDAGSGARVWEKSHNSKVNVIDLARPIGLFTAQKDLLTYSIGHERSTVRAIDGSLLPPVPQPAATEHSWELRAEKTGVEIDKSADRVVAEHTILWRPSSFRIQSGRLYAFTADGHAYAMSDANASPIGRSHQ